jgi:pteridine reductase
VAPAQAPSAQGNRKHPNGIPLQRLGDPQDIARTIAFLLDEAPYISGQIIAVDGGRSL